jgi:hypothetical protein
LKIKEILGSTRVGALLKFYKFVSVPILLYELECWTYGKNMKQSRIKSAEMRLLRQVMVTNCFIIIRNAFNVRRELKSYFLTKELKQEGCVSWKHGYRLTVAN